ncbi:MAG: hypothetical protein MHMPM18_002539 [Marteilia pararefringens]
MAAYLDKLVNRRVQLLTCDGRIIIVILRICVSLSQLFPKINLYEGILRSFDQMQNLILDKSIERIFSLTGVEINDLGVYIVRGENMCMVGEVEENIDRVIDYSKIAIDPIKSCK